MLDIGTSSIVEADTDDTADDRKESLRKELIKYREIAASHCENMLDATVKIIKSHIGVSFFAYDASLVRDGVFYAGYMLAKANDREDDMEMCLKALGEMRWAFCKRATRIQTVRGVYAGVRQAKEVRARRDEEERRRQNARRTTIPSQQPPRQQSYNTSTGFSPQQAYAPTQAPPQTSSQVNIHRYLMSSTESYLQGAAPVQTDAILPANVDLQGTSPGSQLSVGPSKDESVNIPRMTLPATHSPSSASEHSEPAELPPQSYHGAIAPFVSPQHGVPKGQPMSYPPALVSQQTPHPILVPHQQRNPSPQSLVHPDAHYATQQPNKLSTRYSPQQYPLQQQLYPGGVSLYPPPGGPSMAPPSVQRADPCMRFAGAPSTQSSIHPSPPGGGMHAAMYSGMSDPASAVHLQTKFDMDVAEWMSTQRLHHPYTTQYQTQLPTQAHYSSQPMATSQHSQEPRGHAMYPPNPPQNPHLHEMQAHPQYPHTQKGHFYSGQ
jgi:hypothetical protein